MTVKVVYSLGEYGGACAIPRGVLRTKEGWLSFSVAGHVSGALSKFPGASVQQLQQYIFFISDTDTNSFPSDPVERKLAMEPSIREATRILRSHEREWLEIAYRLQEEGCLDGRQVEHVLRSSNRRRGHRVRRRLAKVGLALRLHRKMYEVVAANDTTCAISRYMCLWDIEQVLTESAMETKEIPSV
jgi:hypothetical protein